MANNSKLLNNGEEEKKEEILEKLKVMDTEKLAAILKLMGWNLILSYHIIVFSYFVCVFWKKHYICNPIFELFIDA